MQNKVPDSLQHLMPEDWREVTGGLQYMDGWQFNGDYTSQITGSGGFEDYEEARQFIEGRGRYSDRNSFHYTEEDTEEWKSEGFFGEAVCPNCILEAEPDEEIDAGLSVVTDVSRENSFRPGKEKVVAEMFYGCTTHPEVGVTVRRKSYTDTE